MSDFGQFWDADYKNLCYTANFRGLQPRFHENASFSPKNVKSLKFKAPFTRYRFHFISDWFHIGLAFCLHDNVFIPYRIGLLFTRERTNPICLIPF